MKLDKISLIFKDDTSLKLFLTVAIICLLCGFYSLLLGFYLFALILTSAFIALNVANDSYRKHQFQKYLTSLLSAGYKESSKDPERIFIAKGLDLQIENFFDTLIDKYICDWYSKVTHDQSFIGSIKYELAFAIREISKRYKNIDYAFVISTKLIPIIYTHISAIESIIKNHKDREIITKYLESGNSIHPAVFNRKSEQQYLRNLAETLIPQLSTSSNLKCSPAFNIVRELLSNLVFLPLTDLIADPNTINTLVILATNKKTTSIRQFNLNEKRNVELLANFMKTSEDSFGAEECQDGNDFFKDQEKLYNFMHFLRNKSMADVELLKFVLDVDHLNAESRKSYLQPSKVSELSFKSEALLQNYNQNLCRNEISHDLQTAYNQAKSLLEEKWKKDFYRSADYYKLTYGDRETFITSKNSPEKDDLGEQVSSQRLSTRIRNAMAMKVAVDGIDESDIQVWDALDVANSPSYYNSMSVKLRRERGQDLENFMLTFYHSIEQEADIGEDISAQLHTKSHRRTNSKQKNSLEMFQNFFNVPQSSDQQYTTSFVKTPCKSFLYFLAKIIKVHPIILRAVTGIAQLLPDANSLVLMAIRKLVNRLS